MDIQHLISARIDAITAIVEKGAITTPALDGGGKKQPKQGAGASGLVEPEKCDCAKADGEACKCAETTKDVSLSVDIVKAQDDKQLVTGVVLEPETVDGQGDIYSAAVIEEAAHNFLAAYGATTKLGFQHKDWTPGRFALVESWITDTDTAIGGKTVKAGSWIMKVKVLDAKVWKMVKEGKVKGFSIGGKAKVKKLKADEGQKGAQQL